MPEHWLVNGVDLDSFAWKIEDAKGLMSTPGLRGTDIEVPGRHGAVLTAASTYQVGQLLLAMWVKGVDPDTGVDPADEDASLAALHAHVDDLAALFHSRTLTIDHVRSDGSVRRAVGRLSQTLDFAREPASPAFGRFAVSVRLPDAFWFDVDPADQPMLQIASDDIAELWAFAGATAPMDGLDITVGPCWNVVLTDMASGAWFAYDAPVGVGQALRIDCAARRVYGDGGLVVDQGRVRHGGAAGRLFELWPGRPPTVGLTSSGPDPVSVQVAGKRAYLTA